MKRRVTVPVGGCLCALLLSPSALAAEGNWTDQPLPQQGRWSSVDTVAPSDQTTWAFGKLLEGNSTVFHSIAFRSGPDGWESVRIPDIGRVNGSVAVAEDDVWAVGDLGSIHWDGKQWQQIPVQNPPGSSTIVHGTTAFGPDDVWAVGAREEENSQAKTGSVQHWDGQSWQDVPVPDLGDKWYLHSIDGTGPNDIWAVGGPSFVDGPGITLHWDGQSWQQVPAPTPDSSHVHFSDVSAAAPDDVWAVGTRYPEGSKKDSPLAMHWDGQQWTVGMAPAQQGGLYDVMHGHDGTVWSVGTDADGQRVMRYDGDSWQPMPDPPTQPGLETSTTTGAILQDGGVLAAGAASEPTENHADSVRGRAVASVYHE